MQTDNQPQITPRQMHDHAVFLLAERVEFPDSVEGIIYLLTDGHYTAVRLGSKKSDVRMEASTGERCLPLPHTGVGGFIDEKLKDPATFGFVPFEGGAVQAAYQKLASLRIYLEVKSAETGFAVPIFRPK